MRKGNDLRDEMRDVASGKKEYLELFAEWRKFHPGCSSEEALSAEWDKMNKRQRQFALDSIKTHVIIAKVASGIK